MSKDYNIGDELEVKQQKCKVKEKGDDYYLIELEDGSVENITFSELKEQSE